MALPASELPDKVVAGVRERVPCRGEKREVRFDWRSVLKLLPVWWEGRLQLLWCGNRDHADRNLPPTGWTWQESVAAGRWAGVRPVAVEVPANYALMNGVWFKVKRGGCGGWCSSPRPTSRWCTWCASRAPATTG